MAFPTIPTVAASRVLTGTQADTSGTRTFPSLTSLTKNSGDLLIAIIGGYGGAATNPFGSWGGGFTSFVNTTNSGLDPIGAAYKWSTGSETGTFTVTQAATVSGHASFILMSIPGANLTSAPEAGSRAQSSASAADTPAKTATWGADDNLWIAYCTQSETSTSGAFNGPTASPTNYSGDVITALSQDAVGGVQAGVGFRQLNAASEDAGTWTVDTSSARNSVFMMVVRPITFYAKQNAAVSAFVASGADVATFAETSNGIEVMVASGASEYVGAPTVPTSRFHRMSGQAIQRSSVW